MKYIVIAHCGVKRALMLNKIDSIETDIILIEPAHIEHIRLIQDMVLDLTKAETALVAE